jgi:hypothetical protein
MGWIARIPGLGDVRTALERGGGLFDGGGRVPLNFWLFGSRQARSKGPSRSKKPQENVARGQI